MPGERSAEPGADRPIWRLLAVSCVLLVLAAVMFRAMLFGGDIAAPEGEHSRTDPPSAASLAVVVQSTVPRGSIHGIDAVFPGGSDPTAGELLAWRAGAFGMAPNASPQTRADVDAAVARLLERMAPEGVSWALNVTGPAGSALIAPRSFEQSAGASFLAETSVWRSPDGSVRIQLIASGAGGGR